jgi:hypothetical protein
MLFPEVVGRVSSRRMIAREVTAMNSNTGTFMHALAYRTREALMARRALYAAASIHMIMVAVLFTSLAVLVHAISA